MPKVLIITGPTATGKTALAQLIASKTPSELISADSRQVYKGLDIGTGKDHSPKIKIHMIDILTPDQTFSAHDFALLASQKIKEIQAKNKLPLIIGGTGYYINALLNPQDFNSPNIQNNFLFLILNKLNIKFLKYIYKFLDKNSFDTLNHSEQNNPHRLVKRILLSFRVRGNRRDNLSVETLHATSLRAWDVTHIHLDAPTEFIHPKIDKRVESRLEQGLLAEIQELLKKYKFSHPGLNTLAYQEFEPFFLETDTLQNCVDNWTNHEKQYAKRQKTYFKKFFPKALVFDITKPGWQNQALKLL